MKDNVILNKMSSRLESSKDESDLAYFYDLMNYGEFITKIITLFMVSSINDDKERTRYRFEYNLIRANSIGDFSKTIDEILTGPSAQILTSTINDFEYKELSKRASEGDWQFESQKLLLECIEIFGHEINKINSKSALRNWFQNFSYLRNKTKGHGAPKVESCSKACIKLEKSIDLIVNNFTLFKRNWCYLYRNLSGKYRVSDISNKSIAFDYLKKEDFHNLENGIYIFLDKPRHLKLLYSNPELTDFWITNGNLKKEKFEALSYISDERIYCNASMYFEPISQLPVSHTEGTNELEVIGDCFTNLPKAPDFYVSRQNLEDELQKVLLSDDRFPIITLLGKGGVGKTSLAINLIEKIAKNNDRFEVILWFSARDIDLLLDGPKQVQTKVLNINDIAKDYCELMYANENITDELDKFSKDLTLNPNGKTLYVFDNFETLTNPIEVFEWINTYIRNPNKILITSRLSRNFKADYPIEVQGMSDDECRELISITANKLDINEILNANYIDELISESSGHPYIIKILLGEVAKNGKIGSIRRIVTEQERILDALFKRTFNNLSPSAKRVFLTLCSWNSMIPKIALEAVLWRPENEKIDVQKAIEELKQCSFIDVINDDKSDELISLPLAAAIYGKGELEVYPEKIKIYADRKLLFEFGTTSHSNLSNGLMQNIEKKFKSISSRIKTIKEFEKELGTLEYIATKFPKTYKYIIEIFEEYEEYEKVKYYIREYLKNNLLVSEKIDLWKKLASVCNFTNDWEGESHALIELIQLPNISFEVISETANKINSHIYHNMDAKLDFYKSEILNKIIEVMIKRITNEGTATDYSRLGWLLLNNNERGRAEKIVEKGLELDDTNDYCLKLLPKIIS
ncbi:NB-ARC domain-containing protein [Flavobacterium sp. XS1P27]|uniref:NB-ARC domain-containing protein n=1 Tax=Flavobacterium sp. XS1P27 TaxID=3401724 RepID=UPI003AAD7420